jgi:hypothetical protein
MYKRLRKLEHKRVPGIERNVHLAAQHEALLCMVLVDAVDDGGAAKGIKSINGAPRVVYEEITNMSFQSG